MSARKALAVARHAAQTNARTPMTRVGLALLVAVALLGPVVSLRNHGVWALDPQLLGTGFAFGALFVLRSGLVEQRLGGMQALLRANFVTPVEHIIGAIVSLTIAWIGLSAWALLVALVLSGGDLGLSAWTVWLLFLTSGMLLPFALMVECASDLRTPIAVPGFLYFAGVFTLSALLGYQRVGSLLGLNADRAWPPSSLPLAARAGVALLCGFALVVAATWLRARRREGVRRAGPPASRCRSGRTGSPARPPARSTP